MKATIIFGFLFLSFYTSLFSQTVYVTKTGSKYHIVDCSRLKSSIEVELKDIVGKYEPCSICKPPVLSKNENNLNQEIKKSSTTKKDVSSNQCQGMTKKKKQCSRKAMSGSNYCWQHSR